MDKKNISYKTNTDVDEMERLGLRSVPAISVDGKLMDYNQAMDWVASYREEQNEKQ